MWIITYFLVVREPIGANSLTCVEADDEMNLWSLVWVLKVEQFIVGYFVSELYVYDKPENIDFFTKKRLDTVYMYFINELFSSLYLE